MKPFFPSPFDRNRHIGLLGGSFNPAHEGHLHISLLALKVLKLDEIWWMVSPLNPLKSTDDMADFDTRFASAKHWAQHPKIRVSDVERKLGTRYTHATIAQLRRRMPKTRFVWLMGADNLAGFHRWQRWRDITRAVPIAVFDRAPFSKAALYSKAARAFARRRLKEKQFPQLPDARPPALAYLHLKRHPMSASFLRKQLGKTAFLRHNKSR